MIHFFPLKSETIMLYQKHSKANPSASVARKSTSYHDIQHRVISQKCRKIPPNLFDDRRSGDMVCKDCGLIVEAGLVDERAEWRTFQNDDNNNGSDPSRVGEASNHFGAANTLTTYISSGKLGQNAYNDRKTQASLVKSQAMVNAAWDSTKVDLSVITQKDECCAIIDELKEPMGMPALLSTTAKIFIKQALDHPDHTFRERRQRVFVASCLYFACKLNGDFWGLLIAILPRSPNTLRCWSGLL